MALSCRFRVVAFASIVALVSASNPASVRQHCQEQGNLTFKEPSGTRARVLTIFTTIFTGELKYKYLVPGGFYDQVSKPISERA